MKFLKNLIRHFLVKYVLICLNIKCVSKHTLNVRGGRYVYAIEIKSIYTNITAIKTTMFTLFLIFYLETNLTPSCN